MGSGEVEARGERREVRRERREARCEKQETRSKNQEGLMLTFGVEYLFGKTKIF